MSTEANRGKAQAGLSAIIEALEAEVRAAGAEGLRNDQVARALDLQTEVNGGQRNHLTHALLNRLTREGALARDKRGNRIYYTAAR